MRRQPAQRCRVAAPRRPYAGALTDSTAVATVIRDSGIPPPDRGEIRIVQQDLGFGLGRADVLFPDSTVDRLIDFLRQGRGDIYIVLSNLGAKGKSGMTQIPTMCRCSSSPAICAARCSAASRHTIRCPAGKSAAAPTR